MSQSLDNGNSSLPLWSLNVRGQEISPALIQTCRTAVQTVLSRQEIGFTKIVARSELAAAVETRSREIGRTFKHLVVVGIGGSSLGGRALLSALPKPAGHGQVSFLDNIDADRFWTWLKGRHDLDSIHWLLVSKSGNTMETLALADLVDQHLRQTGHRRLAVVSTVVSETKENPLTTWARRESVPILEIPRDIGGRFSVLTAVGLFPAAYSGLRVDRLMQGADWALRQEELIGHIAALSLSSFLRQEWVTMLWSYAEGLREFGAWWQQLWAESLAKKTNRKGTAAPRVSTPIPAVGANDQHSLLQQVMEGAPDKFVWFHRVSASEESGPKLEKTLFEGQDFIVGKGLGDLFRAEADATMAAMVEAGVSTATLRTAVLDEQSIAGLFMLWQMVIAVMGEVLEINAFDQPGVEIGKKLARATLASHAN